MKLTSQQRQDRINKSYSQQYQAAHADLEAIMNALVKHDADSYGDRNYAHVGDVQATADDLKEIADRLLGRGEYAPENIAR